MKSPGALISVAILTALGGWLRFASIGFGLPDHFRPDEELTIPRAIGFATSGDLDPHFQAYPGLQMYVEYAALRAAAAVHGQSGNFIEYFSADNQSRAYRVSRETSAVFGTATIPAMFAAASVFGPGAGLVAAAIMTVAPLHVRDSKFATTDAAATFWLTMALAMILRIDGVSYRRYATAGILCGLAAATKYPAGIVVSTIVTRHLQLRGRTWASAARAMTDSRMVTAGLSAMTAFAIASPYTILDWHQTAHDLFSGIQLNGVTESVLIGPHWPAWIPRMMGSTPAPLRFFVGKLLSGAYGSLRLAFHAMPDSFGAPFAILLVVAMVWGWTREREKTLALIVLIAVALAGLVTNRFFFRYLLTPFPAMTIVAAAFLCSLTRGEWRSGRWVAGGLLAAILIPSALRDIELNRLLREPDTRAEARVWIESRIPRGESIAVTAANPFANPPLSNDYTYVPFGDFDSAAHRGTRWIVSAELAGIDLWAPQLSAAAVSELNSRAELLYDNDPIVAGARAPTFDKLDAFFAPLNHIASMRKPGPRLRIWKIKSPAVAS
jgi:hypothetical protein